MERPVRKIICTSQEAEDEPKTVRGAIWEVYHKLKEASPDFGGLERKIAQNQ